MATLLQTQIITFLLPIVVFLLLFVVLYALLQKTKILGGIKGFDALAAFAVAILFLLVPEGTQVITLFTPWVMLFGLLVIVIFMFFMFLGASGSAMGDVIKNSTFITFSVAIVIILFLVALTQVYGPFLVTTAEAGFWNATKRAIFHPKLLGALFLLIVAAYTIHFITINQ